MPVPTFSGLPPHATFQDHEDKINTLVNQLRNLLLNLDTLNIAELSADVINAGTINANLVQIRSDLTTGYIQIDKNGMVVNNGLYDTFKVDMNGAVTMTSALVQSAVGYPKVVMDPVTTLFGAYYDEDDFIEVQAGYGTTNSLNFWQAGNLRGRLNTLLGYLEIYGANGLLINADQNAIEFAGEEFQFPDWHSIVNGNGDTLYESFAHAGISTGMSGGHNHSIPDGTRLATTNGTGTITGYVTWSAAPNHSHEQI